MSEQADADDDVPFQGQLLLRFEELLLEARAAAKGDDFVFADHGTSMIKILQSILGSLSEYPIN